MELVCDCHSFVLSIILKNSTMKKIITSFRNSNLLIQAVISIASYLLYRLTSSILTKNYVASKFPVSYFEAQTSFNAEKIKEWYQFILNENTMDIYFKTQLIDFLFIAAVILMGFSIWTLVANFHKKGSFFNKWGYFMAFSLPFAGFFDFFENLVSFYMLAEPKDFINGIVYVYSSFATIKFGFWVIALLWLSVSIIVLVFNKIKKLFTRADAHKV